MKINVIGSGFSSLAASCYLAKDGHEVVVHEKNGQLGGRAQQLREHGYVFDMGPTWYWMPGVFERFFADFGRTPSDYYKLERLDPAYQVCFEQNQSIQIPGNLEGIIALFERIEKGSGKHLTTFMEQARANYALAVENMVYLPGRSPLELVNLEALKKAHLFLTNIRKQVGKNIKNEQLRRILEFPVLFLGAKPQDTPALYNFMNWADFGLGTWHPKGGMGKVVDAMISLAKELGVTFRTNSTVQKICVDNNKKIRGIETREGFIPSDVVLSGADYHHTESLLEDDSLKQYSARYWYTRTFAPSALLYYVGFNTEIRHVAHHTLFFDTDFDAHAHDIYDVPKWPKNPLFYCSFPSKTDASMAPKGKEAATFLVPLAPGLPDSASQREHTFANIISRLEKLTGQSLEGHIEFKRAFGIKDFIGSYNSYRGNAYGLANTLKQTAFLRPNIQSSKIENLFFTGQLTVPGPGVPPALISGKIAAGEILKRM
ncbi:MAG: phytoene desaturase family protein [Flavobacteriaceae bacterium]